MEMSDSEISLIREEAAEWVLKWRKGRKHVDQREFSDWLARSPTHYIEFNRGRTYNDVYDR